MSCVRIYITSKRIELESPCWSGFEALEILYKIWATGTFQLNSFRSWGFLQWSMNMCHCKNWICCFLLRSSISPKKIKLESCDCAQKKRLELLFPDLIKFFKFSKRGSIENLRSKVHLFSSVIWCKFYSDPLKTANRSVSRPIFLDFAHTCASKLLLTEFF